MPIEIHEILRMYLCGLIAADGYLDDYGIVVIAQKDKEFIDIITKILRKLRIYISSVFYDKTARVWKIKIRDKEFYDYLLKNGLKTGRKSESVRPPSIEPNTKQALAYIIGFIDGDGWIEQVKKRRRGKVYYYMRIGIKTKSKEIRDWMIKVLTVNGIRPHKADKKDGYEIHIDTLLAWKLACYLLNPRHKKKLMNIRDDRTLRS